MAYDSYCPQNSECQSSLESIEEEHHQPPLLQLRQPRFQFRQMSEMQFHPLLQKEHSPNGNLGHPLSQALQRPNIVRHLRPPRPLSQTLAECKQNALVPQLQEENAPMQKLRKPHHISSVTQKQNTPSQQARLVRLQQPTAEKVQLLPEQQKPSLEQQQSSLKEPQPLRKQQQPSPDQQELSLKQQQPSPKEQQPSVKQQQTLPKQVQNQQPPSSKQQPLPSKQQQASLKQQQSSRKPSLIPAPRAQAITPEQRLLLAKNNNDELRADSADDGKKSSGSILKVKKKTTPNNERRRLINEELRKILMPKNAISVLNELLPFQLGLLTVHQTSGKDPKLVNFCAEITVDDISYKGYGGSKAAARHDVAEQVLRDFILKQMVKQIEVDASNTAERQQEEGEKEPLPMVQLASFALHKLFTAWERAGHKVPLLKQLVTPTQ